MRLILEVTTGQTVSSILSSTIVFSTQSFLVVYNTDRIELLKCSAKQRLFQSPLVHGESLKILPKSFWDDFARVQTFSKISIYINNKFPRKWSSFKVHLRICYGSEHLCNRTVIVDAYAQMAFTCLKPDMEALEQGVTSV